MSYRLYNPPTFRNKKEKRRTLIISFIGMILGALATFGITQLDTAGNLFLAILAYLFGMVTFVSFWVFVISLFEK